MITVLHLLRVLQKFIKQVIVLGENGVVNEEFVRGNVKVRFGILMFFFCFV